MVTPRCRVGFGCAVVRTAVYYGGENSGGGGRWGRLASSPHTHVLLEIGRRVQMARKAAGITQEEAAARSGIDYKRFQRVEAGTVNVTVRTMVRISAGLGVTFWQLVGTETRSLRSRPR